MGRRDSLTASKDLANKNIPGPNSTVTTLVARFQNVGLTLNDLVALSGNVYQSLAQYAAFVLL